MVGNILSSLEDVRLSSAYEELPPNTRLQTGMSRKQKHPGKPRLKTAEWREKVARKSK